MSPARSHLTAIPGPGDPPPRAYAAPPLPLTSLVGREAELAALDAHLDRGARLLTLLGPGGVGKTRLALALAHARGGRHADGSAVVLLGSIVEPELVLPSVLHALAGRQGSTGSAEEALTAWLQDRHLLLVLDNFEQVLPAALPLGRILSACPRLTCVVTSRAPLRLAGEQRFPLQPLAVPNLATSDLPDDQRSLDTIAGSPAVQLFVARVQALTPDFVLDGENARAVAGICRQLDGLPLAIELAAARSTLLAPAQLLAHLSPVLPLLTAGPRDAPQRLQTMRDAIAWSYALLSAAEQRAFRRLAAFTADFDLSAARAVLDIHEAGEPAESDVRALEMLAALADQSLLVRHEVAAGGRFVMLETIRAFGQEALAETGEADLVAARQAAWCTKLAETHWRSGSVSRRDGVRALEAEHPHLRRTLAWLLETGNVEQAMQLAGRLAEFWLRLGILTEGKTWLQRALAADSGPPTVARVNALVGLNMLQWPHGAFDHSRRLLAEAEGAARATGDAAALAYVRLHQGYVAASEGDLDVAVARGEEVLASSADLKQGLSQNGVLFLLARTALVRGNDAEASERFSQLLENAIATRDDVSRYNSLTGLATLAERQGQLSVALDRYVAAAQIAQGWGDRWGVSMSLDAVALALHDAHLPEIATRLLAASARVRAREPAPIHVFIDHQERFQAALDALQHRLGHAKFTAAWEAGAQLTGAEAFALAQAQVRDLSVAAAAPTGTVSLTSREREVLRLVARGSSDKEIASELGISPRTASHHVAALRDKLQATSRSAAAAIAVRDHLI